jgi:hypothetical protein
VRPDVDATIQKYRNFTMVPRESILDTIQCVESAPKNGAFVEMGCWRGGICFIMAELFENEIHAFDSFEGFLQPFPIDGKAAQAAWDGPDHCVASREDFNKIAVEMRAGFYWHPGWFQETIKSAPFHISVLRIDCDWYTSVKFCLDKLYEKVLPGGYVIIDDYSAYDGAAIATHEFLGRRRLSHRLHVVNGEKEFQQARFRKQ